MYDKLGSAADNGGLDALFESSPDQSPYLGRCRGGLRGRSGRTPRHIRQQLTHTEGLVLPLAGLDAVLTAMNPHPTTTRRVLPPRDTRSSSWPRDPLQGEIGRFTVIARDASQDLGDWDEPAHREGGRAAATATTGHREGALGQATTGQYRNGRSQRRASRPSMRSSRVSRRAMPSSSRAERASPSRR